MGISISEYLQLFISLNYDCCTRSYLSCNRYTVERCFKYTFILVTDKANDFQKQLADITEQYIYVIIFKCH